LLGLFFYPEDGVDIFHKMELFITTIMRTSNPICEDVTIAGLKKN
jgi:hypothetical protein